MKLLLTSMLLVSLFWKFSLPVPGRHKPIPIKESMHTTACDTAKNPVVILRDTALPPMITVVIRDTAAATADMNRILSRDYGELIPFIYQNGLHPLKMMIFYYSDHLPFILDAGIEVDKLPNRTEGRIKVNKLNETNAVVAHYQGPYAQIKIAYTALGNYLVQYHKTASGLPFEVYLNDPASVTDSFELRTDIYQPIK